MIEINDLYVYAESHGIETDYFKTKYAPALSVLIDGEMCIAINPAMIESTADEKVKLAHEIGHCETGSFYNRRSPNEIIKKCENRAVKWAIKKLIPKDELEKAVKNGIIEFWDLAEHFNVTEDFVRKAILFYWSGHL